MVGPLLEGEKTTLHWLFCVYATTQVQLIFLVRTRSWLLIVVNWEQVDSLEQRVVALEKGATFDATQTAIRRREEEMLVTLREIREQMVKDAGMGSASSAEMDELKKENEKLKATIAKQEYRIRHLIVGMEDLLAAKKAA